MNDSYWWSKQPLSFLEDEDEWRGADGEDEKESGEDD